MIRFPRRFIDPQNQYRRWIDPRVRTLRQSDVVRYLERRGWKQVPGDHLGLLVFQEPPGHEVAGRPYYQVVPDSEEGSDYPLRMFELLTGLAEFEDRQAAEIIDDIVGSVKRQTNGSIDQSAHDTGRETAPPGERPD